MIGIVRKNVVDGTQEARGDVDMIKLKKRRSADEMTKVVDNFGGDQAESEKGKGMQ